MLTTWLYRASGVQVAVVAVLAALVAKACGASPTGSSTGDAICLIGLAGGSVIAASRARWWMLLAAAAVGLGTLRDGGPFTLALLGALAAAAAGWKLNALPGLHALSWALTLNALLRSSLGEFHGLSAIVAGCCTVAVLLSAFRHASSRGQDAMVMVGWAVCGLAVASLIGFGVATWQAYSDLRAGERALRGAEEALRVSDTAEARTQLIEGAARFQQASDATAKPWAQPARWIPVFGQHASLLTELSAGAAQATDAAASAVISADIDSIGINSGTIDLDAIRRLIAPMTRVHEASRDLQQTALELDSPWLLPIAKDRLVDMRSSIAEIASPAERAVTGLSVAPALLGGDGKRTWFIAFLNPAEARGLGGFMGNWAVLTADEGRLTVTDSGRTIELFALGDAPRPRLKMPTEYLMRYGRFGAGSSSQPVSLDYWANITMSPDLPSVAAAMADLFAQSPGGTTIDGVVTIDVNGLEGMLKLTGPLQAPGFEAPISADNVSQFLLTEQYALFPDAAQDERTEALGVLAELATRTMLTSSFAGPRIVADALGPAISGGHIQMWSLKPSDQAALRQLGTAAELQFDTPDAFGVYVNNAAGNKLDAYLDRNITYAATVATDGLITSTATISLTNNAPSGLTAYASGNQRDLPLGTNVAYVSVYSPLRLDSFVVDGVATSTESESELGWKVYSTYLEIPAGQTVEIIAEFAGDLPPGAEYQLTLFRQNQARPDNTVVTVRQGTGEPVALTVEQAPRQVVHPD